LKSELDSERHPFGVVAESVALLRDVPDTRPRKVISQQAGPVFSQHRQILDPTLGGLFWIGIVGEFGQGLLQQQDRMVRQIAYIAERFLTRIDHEDRVPDSVAGRENGMDSRQDFVTVLDEVQSVPIRDEVLAGSVDKGLELLWLALINPEVEVRLCDVELRIGEVARSVVSVVTAEMVNMGVSHPYGVNILRVDPFDKFFSNWAARARLGASAGVHIPDFDIFTRPRPKAVT